MLESGLSNITPDGWLNRFLKNNNSNNEILRAVSLTSNLAKVFQGPYSVSNFADLRNFRSSIPENMLISWSSLYTTLIKPQILYPHSCLDQLILYLKI